MNGKVERLSHIRRIMMMVGAGSFLAWQLPMMDKSERLADSAAGLGGLVSLTGFAIWIATLVYLVGPWSRFSTSKDVNAALNDELVRANRQRAYMVSYAAMMLGAVSLFILSLFVPAKGIEVAHIIMTIGVVAPMFSFAVLERVGGA